MDNLKAKDFKPSDELLEACKWAEAIYQEYRALNPNPDSSAFAVVTTAITEIRKAVKRAEGK